MKNQKGVSLITLVITIIVVIILAVLFLTGGGSDIPNQANFSTFAKYMGDLQESVEVAKNTANGSESIRGNSRTDAQLYNFVARGGYKALPQTADGDVKWLIQSDARQIPATLINKKNAQDSIKMVLPVIKVETDRGTNQELSYFVTPKGNVFCWPPFVYEGKSYVTANVTVKSGDAEMGGTEATEAAQVTISFPNGETVIVDNASKNTLKGDAIDVSFEKGDGDAAFGAAAVWYGADDRETANGHKGVAGGYKFDKYFNTTTAAGSGE